MLELQQKPSGCEYRQFSSVYPLEKAYFNPSCDSGEQGYIFANSGDMPGRAPQPHSHLSPNRLPLATLCRFQPIDPPYDDFNLIVQIAPQDLMDVIDIF